MEREDESQGEYEVGLASVGEPLERHPPFADSEPTHRPFNEAEWGQTPSCPSPSRQTVSGFPRYRNTFASLPPLEQQNVRNIARRIAQSFRPGCQALRWVRLVGHADRDVQRGPAFEQRISIERAMAVQQALQRLIGNSGIVSRIAWQPSGVGAQSLIVPNPRSEADRRRNRRVDITVSAGGIRPVPGNMARAVRENRRYMRSLGWQAYRYAIVRLLGFTISIPSETMFAAAVARWQAQQGLSPDGIIGAHVLARIRAALQSLAFFPGDDIRPAASLQEIPPDPSTLRRLQHEWQGEAGEEADKFVTEQAFGFPQGHKFLTQVAASGLPITPADLDALKNGNARVDDLTKAFDPSEQRRHTLRRTKCQPVADALSEARNHLMRLHASALTAPMRQTQLEMLGEALHLIQDSYSSAHTERKWGGWGGVHPVVFIRFFGFQGSCPFPLEHRVVPPPDPRDTIKAGGGLTPWARESVSASREYVMMALRHFASPGAPTVAAELRAFMDRHLLLDPAHTPTTLCYPACPDPDAPCRCA